MLVPLEMAKFARVDNFDQAQEYGLRDCILCGSCSYVCPSHIPLVQFLNTPKASCMSARPARKNGIHRALNQRAQRAPRAGSGGQGGSQKPEESQARQHGDGCNEHRNQHRNRRINLYRDTPMTAPSLPWRAPPPRPRPRQRRSHHAAGVFCPGPATAFGFYLFGWPAIFLWLFTCTGALITEALCLWGQGQPLARLKDSSALLTGWLLALSLPPWAPWWIGVGGAAFAIGIGKQVYGGLGQNLFNPAMLARVALLISFPVQMSTWANVTPFGSLLAPSIGDGLGITLGLTSIPDGATGATILGKPKPTTPPACPSATCWPSTFP